MTFAAYQEFVQHAETCEHCHPWGQQRNLLDRITYARADACQEGRDLLDRWVR